MGHGETVAKMGLSIDFGEMWALVLSIFALPPISLASYPKQHANSILGS